MPQRKSAVYAYCTFISREVIVHIMSFYILLPIICSSSNASTHFHIKTSSSYFVSFITFGDGFFQFQDNKVSLKQVPGHNHENTMFQPRKCPFKFALVTKREVKMGGLIGQVLFLRFFRPRRNKNPKNEQGQYPAILIEQAFVNKGFIIWPKDYTKEFRFCRNKAGNPGRAR